MTRRPRKRGLGAVRPIVPARRLAGGAVTGAATADAPRKARSTAVAPAR